MWRNKPDQAMGVQSMYAHSIGRFDFSSLRRPKAAFTRAAAIQACFGIGNQGMGTHAGKARGPCRNSGLGPGLRTPHLLARRPPRRIGLSSAPNAHGRVDCSRGLQVHPRPHHVFLGTQCSMTPSRCSGAGAEAPPSHLPLPWPGMLQERSLYSRLPAVAESAILCATSPFGNSLLSTSQNLANHPVLSS